MALPQKKDPYSQYKKTEIDTANQGKLIVMLYDGAIKFLNIAVENMSLKTYDVVNNNIIKAQDIITELMVSLNMKDGGEIATNLFNLYIYFKKRLLEANMQKNADVIKEVIDHLKVLRNAWDKISAQENLGDNSKMASKGSFSIEG
ncbi:MAG: flagellar export chaperone FliS [Spirochaetes bacterium]|jgi:flagellar protein FliS|nr:flagellar export chaperone FliS [Spirochaetota bacterium]